MWLLQDKEKDAVKVIAAMTVRMYPCCLRTWSSKEFGAQEACVLVSHQLCQESSRLGHSCGQHFCEGDFFILFGDEIRLECYVEVLIMSSFLLHRIRKIPILSFEHLLSEPWVVSGLTRSQSICATLYKGVSRLVLDFICIRVIHL